MHSRYKPGCSGNPKGRPRGSKNKNSILKELLAQKVEVRQNGKPRKMSKLAVMLLTLVNKAASGDLRAIALLRPMIENMEEVQAATAKLSEELSVDDREILKEYAERSKNTAQPSAL